MFWERYKELTDWQKWISVIERGEERIEKKIRIKKALAQKVAQYQKPEIQLKMAPGYSKLSDISLSFMSIDKFFKILFRQYAENQEIHRG